MNKDIKKYSYYDITLLVEDPEDNTKLQQYIPKTYAEGVFLEPEQLHSAKDHLSDIVHIHEDEKERFEKVNEEDGFVVLNDYGKIPLKCFSPHQLFLHFEYDTVKEMLENNDYTDADYGHLVMVKDNSEKGVPGWVVYRFLGGDSSNYDNWQWVFREDMSNLVVTWDVIDGRPVSTTRAIDRAVSHSHRHDLRALNGLHDENGELWFKDKQIMFKSTPTMYGTDDHEAANKGDVVIERTDTFDPSQEEGVPIVGNCDGLYRGRTMTAGYHLDTTGVTSAIGFYINCYSLETVPEYNLLNCVDVSYFVANCFKIMTFLTREFLAAERATGFFMNCKYLKRVPMMHFPKVTDASEFIKGCIRLESVSTFMAPLVTNINDFANGCKKLATQVPFSNLENVTSSARVYRNCESLEVASFNVPNSVDISEAFYGCSKLRTLTNVDIRSAAITGDFLTGCENLDSFEIVPGGITKTISFVGTKLSEASAIGIINHLPNVSEHQELILSGTPARFIDSSYANLAREKGWIVVR